MKGTLSALLVISVLSCLDLSPAYAGNGDAVGAGLLGLGIGAVVGSALTPQTVYVAPSPPDYGPATYGPPRGVPRGTAIAATSMVLTSTGDRLFPSRRWWLVLLPMSREPKATIVNAA